MSRAVRCYRWFENTLDVITAFYTLPSIPLLMHWALWRVLAAPAFGFHFDDTIALGSYNDDTHHLTVCTVSRLQVLGAFSIVV